MSFLLHTKDFVNDDFGAISHDENLSDWKWILDKDDLAEFSTLYTDDKHELLLAKVAELGGVEGIAFALHSDKTKGLSEKDLTPENIEIRQNKFGKNEVSKIPPKSFFELCWDALQDLMLLILIIAGAANIPLGMADPHEDKGWLEGVAVLLAVVIVVLTTGFNDYQKQKQFRDMEAKSEKRKISVFRNGVLSEIPDSEVMVGDVIDIHQGNAIPCDGLCILPIGEVSVTEASLTGENKPLKKNTFSKPLLLKGSECVGGEILMLCTAVGDNTATGKIMSGIKGNRVKQREQERKAEQGLMDGDDTNKEEEEEDDGPCCTFLPCPLFGCDEDDIDTRTPLQKKLDVLAQQIGYVGTGCAFLLFHINLFDIFLKDHVELFLWAFLGACITLVFLVTFFYCQITKKFDFRSALPCIGPVCCPDMDEEEGGEKTADDVANEVWDPFENPKVIAVINCMFLFFVQMDIHMLSQEWTDDALNFFILSITIIVVAVPEGLPLAVTISLAYSMRKMYHDQNFVRHLAACETMGNATTICSDKTGTLTQNLMTVVQMYGGGKAVGPREMVSCEKKESSIGETIGYDFAELLAVSISCNSRGVIKKSRDPDLDKKPEWKDMNDDDKRAWELEVNKEKVLGILIESETNQTESATLLFTMKILGEKEAYADYRRKYPNEKYVPFDSKVKMSSVLVVHDSDKKIYRLYVKGACERIVQACEQRAISGGGKSMDDVKITPMDQTERSKIKKVMNDFTGSGLRTLGLAYRELTYDEIEWVKDEKNKTVPGELKMDEKLTFLTVVGIKDPVRHEVPDAVKECQSAGIVVRMVTGDHLETAKHIAKECHILTSHEHVCMTGAEFREMLIADETGPETRLKMKNLRVVARSRPDDKERMVEWYKKHNSDVVSVTGDGANDALALKEAHVGLAMYIAGTDVAKEASDIMIMDDNFASIVKTVTWGRCVYDNIRKFVQFQLTVNVVALTISVLAPFLREDRSLNMPLRAVQLLWVNLIMDTLAALALATEMPTKSLLQRRPYKRETHLISRSMWRFVAVHSVFQLIILIIVLVEGENFLDLKARSNYKDPDEDDSRNEVLMSIVFNTFVWFQIFNEINARKVNGEWNVIEHFFDNWMFSFILLITIICQVVIVEVEAVGTFAHTKPLTGKQWLFCVLVGAISFPVGQLTLFFPVDLEQGMVEIDYDECFRVDSDFAQGHTNTRISQGNEG